MPTLEEFQQKVKEIRDQIDFENSSPQKLRTLLQAIKDYCAHTLEDPTIKDTPLEKEVMNTIFQTEKDLARVKTMNISGIPPGGLPPLVPTAQPISMNQPLNQNLATSPMLASGISGRTSSGKLDSVPAGAFDPNSSPILRRLREKTSLSQSTQTPREIEIKPQKEQPTEPAPFKAAPFPTPTPMPESNPFPTPTKPKLMPAYLEVPQLDLKIPLEFNDAIEPIGQENFTATQLNLNVPDQFFSAILPKRGDGSSEPSEHFVIEQPTRGIFLIKDRANAQKTYFGEAFVDAKGAEIKENDTFILPVMINGQMASLSVKFHVRNN